MSWKCTPQILGLVRGEKKPGQKHRANARAICAEAGKERISQSETLDPERSKYNQYSGYDSGFALADDLEKEADAYRQKYKKRDGTFGERPLRKDAVIGFAVIFNPPGEICANWDDATYQKFYEDSWAVLCKIQPNVFSDKNLKMTAEHYDEGMQVAPNVFTKHTHYLGVPKDGAGRYCGNLIDAKLMDTINRTYPQMMRQYGWDMADLDCTDFAKEKGRNKSGKGGKSVNEYLRDKLRQKLTEADKVLKEVEELQSELDEMKEDLQGDRDALNMEWDYFEGEQKEWQEKANRELLRAKLGYKAKAQQMKDAYTEAVKKLESAIADVQSQKSDDDVLEVILDKCEYRYRSARDGKVYKVTARDYYNQLKARRQQSISRAQETLRDVPDIVKMPDEDTDDFGMGR